MALFNLQRKVGPKGVCQAGWEVEELSRATGFKNVQKGWGNEPADQSLPRENEPGRPTLKNGTLQSVETPREDEPGDNRFEECWE